MMLPILSPRGRLAPARDMLRVAVMSALTLLTLTSVGAQGRPAPARDARDTDAPSMPREELVRQLRALADSLARQERFSGVVMLAQDGDPIFTDAYGDADREAGRRNTSTTTFNVSSIGKLFTMLAVAQLVADGRLAMDGTIARYWPDYPDPAARAITIRQLLDHRSGIAGDIFANPAMRRSNHDALELVVHTPLAFPPGARTQYSNAGFVVLGEIIARVSKEPYEDYIRQHVFTAAGMRATGFYANDALPSHAAIGYTRGAGEGRTLPTPLPPLQRNTAVQPRQGSAAGGSYSNAGDLLRFLMARRNGTLGVPPRREQTISAGGSPGSNGIIAEGLPGGYDLIVLSNFDPPSASLIAEQVERWLGGGSGGVRIGGPPRIVRGADGADAQAASGGSKELPDTPVGRVAKDYLRAFATGDTALMRNFMLAHVVPGARSWDDRVAQYGEMFAENGALTLDGIDDVSDREVTMRVTGARSGPLTVNLRIEASAPYRIAGMQFRMER